MLLERFALFDKTMEGKSEFLFLTFNLYGNLLFMSDFSPLFLLKLIVRSFDLSNEYSGEARPKEGYRDDLCHEDTPKGPFLSDVQN